MLNSVMYRLMYESGIGRTLVLTLFCIFGNVSATLHIAGCVVDCDSLPVQGATVRLVGMKLHCATDINGMFTLNGAGVAHPRNPAVAEAADHQRYRESYTLSGRRLHAIAPVTGTHLNLAGKAIASQVVIGASSDIVTRRNAGVSAASLPFFDTLYITHDTHLFRKVAVSADTTALPPVVMHDTSAVFTFAWTMLDYLFLDRHKLTYDPFGYATPEALYFSVNDPYTIWFSHDSAKRYVARLIDNSVGCGIRVDSVAEGYKIKDVFIESPAKNAGITPGDIVVKVGNRAAAGMSRSDFLGYLRGKVGDTVNLTVSTSATTRDVTVILDNYISPSVFVDSLNETTAIVGITGFKSGTTKPGGTEEEFYEALEKLVWTENIIIDLRGNGGGFLEQALGCVSYIVPPGKPLIRWMQRGINSTTGESEVIDSIFTSTLKTILVVKNIAVLADGYTASAAEVFITMLKTAMPQVKIIGTPTYGKAAGQVVAWGPDSTLATVTCMRFSPLSGASYEKVGIQPDIMVAEGDNAVELAVRALIMPVSGKQ